jgi:NAD(P)-dependent dehydrogenase (short-subunit alcohol dehydrogenase family)
MKIEGCVALVTGANRGLGKAFAEGLIGAGAAKVYAGARDIEAITDPRVTPFGSMSPNLATLLPPRRNALTSAFLSKRRRHAALANAAGRIGRSDEPGYGRQRLRHPAHDPLHRVRLARNGGGAIANILSVIWVVYTFKATYCASKHAALAVTEGARIELRAHGTLVVGIQAGFVDTDMAAFVPEPKTPAHQVGDRTLQAIRRDEEQVLADARAEETWRKFTLQSRRVGGADAAGLGR